MTGMHRVGTALLFATVAMAAAAAEGQGPTITVGPVACLPQNGNGVVNATISPEIAGTTTRLYFRRFNTTVEDLYYIEMEPAGGGGYWATFPVPTDDKAEQKKLRNHRYEGREIPDNNRPWAEWWRAKEGSSARNPDGDLDDEEIREKATLGKTERRAWMATLDDAAFQDWLQKQSAEPAEFFVALVNGSGAIVARSEMRVVEVRKDCRVSLTPQQEGYAKNLVIGETAPWQVDDEVFHWECTGIVSRINSNNVLRADDKCRACVIAWWPAAAPAGALAIVGITDDDPIDISPSRP